MVLVALLAIFAGLALLIGIYPRNTSGGLADPGRRTP